MARQDKLGRTPLFYLIANHNFETISSYLEFEYSNWDDRYSFLTEQSTIKDIEGNTPGHILALSNPNDEDLTHDWLGELISNTQNDNGDTPLHLLVKLHDSSTIRQLSYEGIGKDQINVPNNDGYTPLQLAELSGDMEIMELLTR